MKPEVQKIITKLSKNQVELAAERVELAKKPQLIANDAAVIDGKIQKAKKNMDNAYDEYEKSYLSFQNILDKAKSSEVKTIDKEISESEKILKELGIQPARIPELQKAIDILSDLKSDVSRYKKLYPKP
jgi:DNA-directed RNA polymerase subunit H (RpoH/RPB5)